MNLPVYDVRLGDYDEGVYAVSLVEKPAIESDFIYFSKVDGKPTVFYLADEEKRTLIGAVLVPDKLIYREYNGQGFYVRFSKEVIRDIHTRMHEYGYTGSFTIDHSLWVRNGITYLESWIKETDEDKSSAFGIEAPIGTMFMEVKVENDLVWSLVKDGKLKGFSVELDASLSSVYEKIEKKDEKMEFEKLFPNVITVNGNTVRYANLAEKSPVVLEKVEDSKKTFSDFSGEFEFDGKKYVVKDGLIANIVELSKRDNNLFPNELSEKVEEIAQKVNNLFSKLDEQANEFKELDTKIAEMKLELKQKIELKGQDPKPAKNQAGFDKDTYKKISEWGR